MQNYVTYLSRKLQRSLDNNYNVTDMPAVIEIITTLEKTSVTKELLETTRLGKYINELRRKTTNEKLAKRAKGLLKKWRNSILPDANGQFRSSSASSIDNLTTERSNSPCTPKSSSKKRPASSTPPDNNRPTKKMLINGQQNREYEFSDNSNCSVKDLKKTDVIFMNSDSNPSISETLQHGDQYSNDTTTDNTTDSLIVSTTSAQPKKRGRKKGSKNHKNLVIAAEESFTNKMAVSRNSKVKTTQELLADIQNRKPSSQDIELRAAQLTESLSRIEHKLNPQKQINKNLTSIRNDARKSSNNIDRTTIPQRTSTTELQSWSSSRSSPEIVVIQSDDEIVDVVSTEPPAAREEVSSHTSLLTLESLLSQLPPIDKSCLEEQDELPVCVCPTPKVTELIQQVEEERITVQIVGEQVASGTKETSLFAPASPLTFLSEKTERLTPSSELENDERTSCCSDEQIDASRTSVIKSEDGDGDGDGDDDGVVDDDVDKKSAVSDDDNDDDVETEESLENPLCPAKLFLRDKYHLDTLDDQKVHELHVTHIPNVTGNFGVESSNASIVKLFENIVPNLSSERLSKIPNENFQKYSISIDPQHHSLVNNNSSNNCDSDNFKIDNEFEELNASEEIRTSPKESRTSPKECRDSNDFREWHETLDVTSYNNELFRILPYVIID